MNRHIILWTRILFYNLLALMLFGKSTLAQSDEYKNVEECTITNNNIHHQSLFSIFPSGGNGCQFEEEITHNADTYRLRFDVGNNKNNSHIQVIDNQGRNHTVAIDDFIGISTSVTVSLLPLYDQHRPSLLINYVTYGNGFNNCTVSNMVVFDQNIPSGKIRVSADTLNIAEIQNNNPHSFNACFEFQDITGNGILEVLALDGRFGYQFSSGAGSAAPKRVMRFTHNGLEDISHQHLPYLRQQAQSLWNLVLERSNEGNFEYFGYMGAYAGVKSLLGEYQEAKSLIQRRMDIDNSRNRYFGDDFITDLEAFLLSNNYGLR